MGYHHTYQGHLYIQGKERSQIDDDHFLESFVYITHDPMIFKGTLRGIWIFIIVIVMNKFGQF